jgi:hypothetical protein
MIKAGIAQIGETWVPCIGDESGSFVLYLQDARISAGMVLIQEECDRRNAGGEKRTPEGFELLTPDFRPGLKKER